jgi:hypothetical protein
MRIEVSVPGITKDRGKLPGPTTLEPLRLVSSLAAGRPIWGEVVDVALSGPATGAGAGEPVIGWVQPISSPTATADPTIAGEIPLLRFRSIEAHRLARFSPARSSDRLGATSVANPPAVGNGYHDEDFVRARCVGDRHRYRVEMRE